MLWSVLDETLPTGWVPPSDPAAAVAGEPAFAVPEARSAGSADGAGAATDIEGTEEERAQWVRLMRRVPAGVVQLAREMWAVRRLMNGRTEGRLWHRAVANVPAVGVVGATLGERHAATGIATRAYVALGLADELPGI
ncbi:hypothetical protein [Frankia sp. EI5c]|uniref:hypothetical protein n=1 Tax=Frankia sp. EI5c TaxID=683316 RepID=UPI0008247C07|nr:hypothetical protein [Frankia sp. EI5c]